MAERRRCHYCREPEPIVTLTRDHIIPTALGGRDADWNIVDACAICNKRKAHHLYDCDCQGCVDAHDRHMAYLDELAAFDPGTADGLTAAIGAARYLTLDEIVTGPRALLLHYMDREVRL